MFKVRTFDSQPEKVYLNRNTCSVNIYNLIVISAKIIEISKCCEMVFVLSGVNGSAA
jgi:hypothetical protein